MKNSKIYVPAMFEPTEFRYDNNDESDIYIKGADSLEKVVDIMAKQMVEKGLSINKIKGKVIATCGTAKAYINKKWVGHDIETDHIILSGKKLAEAIKASPHYNPNMMLANIEKKKNVLQKELERIKKELKILQK